MTMVAITPKPDTVQAVEVLSDLITPKTVARMFGRSTLTIAVWRNEEGLPFVRVPGDGRDAIRFRLAKVLAWARSTGREIAWTPTRPGK